MEDRCQKLWTQRGLSILWVKALHKRYKDSVLTRIFARVNEVAILLKYSKELLNHLDLSQDSCGINQEIKPTNFEGVGVVEASRGSLIHKIKVTDGIIGNYEIITPTQWNLTHGDNHEEGIAIKAMMGANSVEEASFIFRSFDVCSVCTTQ